MSITDLGIDVGIVVAIGAISEVIKSADPENRFKRFYLFIPIILSALAAVSMALINQSWLEVPLNIIKYFGITAFGYSFIKKTLLKK